MNLSCNSHCLNLGIAALALLLAGNANAEWNKRGDLTFQLQAFTQNSQTTATQDANVSVSGSAEFNRSIGDNGSLTISPFLRLDQHDEERTHFDLREFIYSHSGEDWELNVGLGKVFWGVAESFNVVDIINQRDTVEGFDPEYKLGQPMINLLLLRDWGEISLFVLPGFREGTFAGQDGRPRGFFPVDTDNALFESSAEETHVDVAARVSGSVDIWDIGIHVFNGTARRPLFIFPSFSPFYFQLTQFGTDVQATLDSWLLKSEIVYRSGDAIEDHIEMVNGFEYSFFSVAESNVDIGIVGEWLFDERGDQANSSFQNDLLIGLRLALNDEQSTDALIGVIADLDGGANVFSVEASRRIGDSFRLKFETFIWSNTDDDPLLSQFEQEDFLQFEFAYFF